MKNNFIKLALLGSLVLPFGSCKKDETKVSLNLNASPQLSASAATANITPSTGSSPAVTYTYTAADFNYQSATTYTLQFAIGNTGFAKTLDFNLGNALTRSFTIKQLNDVYNALDCSIPPGTQVTLDVRVKASVGDAAASAISGVKTMTATPYPDVTPPTDIWGLVGPAGDGWPGATATDRVMSYDCRVRGFVLRTAFNAGPFKFRRNRDWGTNLGGVTGDYTKGIPLTTGGPDMVIATAGTYTVTLQVDMNGATVTGGKVTIMP